MKTFAVILAAGLGKRFSQQSHSSQKKQFITIDDEPIWIKAARPFTLLKFVEHLVVVCSRNDIDQIKSEIERYHLNKVISVILGGCKRQDSVYQALQWIDGSDHECDFVIIHDGVRPFVSTDLILRLWEARSDEAVIPGIAILDTVKRCDGKNIQETLDRDKLVRAQTPQLFDYKLLKRGYEKLLKDRAVVTDDAHVIERMEKKVTVIEGDPKNIKITLPQDLPIRSENLISVGLGIDTHAFTEGRSVVLGGIEIPYERSLKGHSDADVLTHAICDAILGGGQV